MSLRYSILAASALALAGCVQTTGTAPTDADPLTAALAGKTLVNDRGQIAVNTDGTLTGTVGGGSESFEGAWAVRDGRWCRTITSPARVAGTACQDATLNGDGTVTIDGVNGPVTYEIR